MDIRPTGFTSTLTGYCHKNPKRIMCAVATLALGIFAGYFFDFQSGRGPMVFNGFLIASAFFAFNGKPNTLIKAATLVSAVCIAGGTTYLELGPLKGSKETNGLSLIGLFMSARLLVRTGLS